MIDPVESDVASWEAIQEADYDARMAAMAEAARLVARARAMAAEPWKHDGNSWPSTMAAMADCIEALLR